MTEFEQQLLQHLQKQADQLTALSLSQSQTTAALLKISEQQAAIFRELSKAPEGESMKNAMAGLLKPLEGNLSALEGVRQVAGRVRSCPNDCPRLRPRRNSPSKRLELEARKPVGITPSSRYHPDNMAKRAAREAAAPGKPAPLTTSDLAELARAEEKRASAARLDAETEARRVAPPQPFDAAGKKAQWDAAIKAERTLYLKEFTVQAHERPWPVWPSTKPTLMPSRCCWAVRSGRKRASASKPRCGQRPRMAKPAGWPLSVHRTGKKAVRRP